jgi:hypothetical protein
MIASGALTRSCANRWIELDDIVQSSARQEPGERVLSKPSGVVKGSPVLALAVTVSLACELIGNVPKLVVTFCCPDDE